VKAVLDMTLTSTLSMAVVRVDPCIVEVDHGAEKEAVSWSLY
jgi:hypothetical protein